MYNGAVLKLYEAGFNVYEIAQSLAIEVADVRAELNHTNDSNGAPRNFELLQQVLHDVKLPSSAVSALRAAVFTAHAANIECQAIALLESRVFELSKLEAAQWTSKHTYELCAILKQLSSATNSAAAPTPTDTRVVNVKFI